MVNDKNWYRTNIDFTGALSEHGKEYLQNLVDHEDIPVVDKRFVDEDPGVLNSEWIEYFNNLTGLTLNHVYVVARPPNFECPNIHIDSSNSPNNKTDFIFAFNWVHGVDDSKMAWYKLDGQTLIQTKRYNVVGSRFSLEDMETFEEVEADIIGNSNLMSFVRVDIPHDIISGNNARVVFSLRVSEENITWDDIVERMKDRGVI